MCRRCWLGFRLVFGLVTIVAALACTASSYSADPTGISCTDCPLIPVDRVIDGDTFDSTYGRVRLYGVDAPERGEECFNEATDRLRELAGDSVRVDLGPREMDEFNRVLAYVFTQSGASIDETLIKEGLALEREDRQQGIRCLW